MSSTILDHSSNSVAHSFFAPTWAPVPALGTPAQNRVSSDLVENLRTWIGSVRPVTQPAGQPLSDVRRAPRRRGRHLFRDEDPLDLDGLGTTLRGHDRMSGRHRDEFAQSIRRPSVIKQVADDNPGTDVELYHALGR